MKTHPPSSRILNLLALLACCLLLATGFYLQMAEGIQPCPLCIIQRLIFIVLGLCLMVACMHNPKRPNGIRTYGILTILLAGLGCLVAGRHIWMQMHPITGSAKDLCFPGFANIFAFLPPMKALKIIFQSADNCDHISWTFLGLSIPVWSFVSFAGLCAVGLWQIIFPRARKF